MVLTLALPVMRGIRWFRVAGFEWGLKSLQFRGLGSVQGLRVHPGRGPRIQDDWVWLSLAKAEGIT